MRAARFHGPGQPLVVEEAPDPKPTGAEVVVRIAAAGVCHSDLHICSGEFPLPPDLELPATMGHENAGFVDEVGPDVVGLQKGDAVAVFGGRGCGTCRVCHGSDEQVCGMQHWITGGFAERMLVAHERFLIKIGDLDPVEAAPLTDAGLTPYRAIRKAMPHLYPGASVVVIGVGGLGHMALQLLGALAPWARVIAVDVADDKLDHAKRLGASEVVDGRGDAAAEILKITAGEGAQAVIDLVGIDSTMALGAAVSARQGILVIVGLGGGTIPFNFFSMRAEGVLTTSYWGSYNELAELLELAQQGRVRVDAKRYPLDDVNAVLDELEHGRITGRAVLVP